MNTEAAITGIGLILPHTKNLDELWNHQLEAGSFVAPLSERIAGTVIGSDFRSEVVSPRLWKKIDAFTRFAMVAVKYALDDAKLDLQSVEPTRTGVLIGNCFGGWLSTEVELRNLYTQGPRAVSPFQATSWFPAAPQGQLTIHYGIRGFSKTYMADRASSLMSVASAANMVRRGLLDVALAGGTESTNTEFVRAALEKLSPEEQDFYAPYMNAKSSGFAISEGAVFFVVESEEHARRRGVRTYARLERFTTCNAPCAPDRYPSDPDPMVRSIRKSTEQRKPDLVLLDASGLVATDRAEAQALELTLPGVAKAAPKQKYGHTFGAEGALDIAFAALMLEKQQALPTPQALLSGSAQATPTRLDSVLIHASATGGAASTLLLARGDH